MKTLMIHHCEMLDLLVIALYTRYKFFMAEILLVFAVHWVEVGTVFVPRPMLDVYGHCPKPPIPMPCIPIQCWNIGTLKTDFKTIANHNSFSKFIHKDTEGWIWRGLSFMRIWVGVAKVNFEVNKDMATLPVSAMYLQWKIHIHLVLCISNVGYQYIGPYGATLGGKLWYNFMDFKTCLGPSFVLCGCSQPLGEKENGGWWFSRVVCQKFAQT